MAAPSRLEAEDEAIRQRLNHRFYQGRPHRSLEEAGLVMHMLDPTDFNCHGNGNCRFYVSHARLACSLANVRAPYALLARPASEDDPYASLQVGVVFTSRFAQSALRCSYSLDACTMKACPNHASVCCVQQACAWPPKLDGVRMGPGPCLSGCSWPADDLDKQMWVREEILARCHAHDHRCRADVVGPGALGSFHSELQLDPNAFGHVDDARSGRRHVIWAEAVEAIYVPASPETWNRSMPVAHMLRAAIRNELPLGRRLPPILMLSISSRGAIAYQGSAPFIHPTEAARRQHAGLEPSQGKARPILGPLHSSTAGSSSNSSHLPPGWRVQPHAVGATK